MEKVQVKSVKKSKKKNNNKKNKKSKKSRFCKKHVHLQTMIKTPVKFQKNWPQTVGGVALTRYICTYYICTFIVLKHKKSQS